jgi:hypothetical protein
MAHHQTRFRRTDEDHPAIGKPRAQQADRAVLGLAVEIDQHVAAKNEVIAHGMRGEPFEQIRALEVHGALHGIGKLPALRRRMEIALAKRQRIAAKRIAAIDAARGRLDRGRTDVDRVDAELLVREARVEQRHCRRIRLLARRARGAQHPQHFAGMRHEPLHAAARERRKGFAFAEEPGFRHDERVDQRLALGGGGRQHAPVGVVHGV